MWWKTTFRIYLFCSEQTLESILRGDEDLDGVVGRRKGGRKRPRLPAVEADWEDSSQLYSLRKKLQKLVKLFKSLEWPGGGEEAIPPSQPPFYWFLIFSCYNNTLLLEKWGKTKFTSAPFRLQNNQYRVGFISLDFILIFFLGYKQCVQLVKWNQKNRFA